MNSRTKHTVFVQIQEMFLKKVCRRLSAGNSGKQYEVNVGNTVSKLRL
jgi:hypothetical protein